MKKLLLLLFVASCCDCEERHQPFVVYNRIYVRPDAVDNGHPMMPEGICWFSAKRETGAWSYENDYISFEDSCSKYNIGDTIR